MASSYQTLIVYQILGQWPTAFLNVIWCFFLFFCFIKSLCAVPGLDLKRLSLVASHFQLQCCLIELSFSNSLSLSLHIWENGMMNPCFFSFPGLS